MSIPGFATVSDMHGAQVDVRLTGDALFIVTVMEGGDQGGIAVATLDRETMDTLIAGLQTLRAQAS